MRIALVAAFPFPLAQGSQVFLGEQARALAAAGAEVTLLGYGRGDGGTTPDLDRITVPAWLSPRRLRSGPSPAKPWADAALAALLVRAQRRRRFDAVLAHNAEAMGIALSVRRLLGIPLVYVAHTSWREELETYAPERIRPAAAPSLARLGARLDAGCASRADAVIVLSPDGLAEIGRHARGPVACIPPGARPSPAPSAAAIERACARHGLSPHGYAVYAGNLDAYQGLAELDAAAEQVERFPCVVASHDLQGAGFRALRTLRVTSPGEAAVLVHGARVGLAPRRRAAGFPIKLLGYMEAGLAILARAGAAGSLVHDESAWLLPPEAGPTEMAAALDRLLANEELRGRLGQGARHRLETHHAWPELAQRTLDLLRALPR